MTHTTILFCWYLEEAQVILEGSINNMAESISRKSGPFQVYLFSLGNRRELVLPFLKKWIGGVETLAAVRYKVEKDIKLVRPTLFGLAQETAEAIAERLKEWGADASAFHDQDENRPQFDHNQYGVILLEVGDNRQAVHTAVQEILGIDRLQATIIIDSAPRSILQNASVDQAIAAHERLLNAGAACDLVRPDPVWMDTSTGHIVQSAGDYIVILQLVGFQKMMVRRLLDDLLFHRSEEEREAMLQQLPVVLLQDVSLATAELAKLTFEDFGATVVIQERQERQRLGQSIHAQNPGFGSGSYQIVLEDFDRFKKIALIQEIRQLIPGIFLTDVTGLLKNMPSVVIEKVDYPTAKMIQEKLVVVGAEVRIKLQT